MSNPDDPPVMDVFVRGAHFFGQAGLETHAKAKVGDPMILTREPTNPNDSNAIIVATPEDQPIGYIAREYAAILAPWMDRGWVYMGKIIQPALVKADVRRRRNFIKVDSLVMRCIPLRNLKAPVTKTEVFSMPSNFEHVNCRSIIKEKTDV